MTSELDEMEQKVLEYLRENAEIDFVADRGGWLYTTNGTHKEQIGEDLGISPGKVRDAANGTRQIKPLYRRSLVAGRRPFVAFYAVGEVNGVTSPTENDVEPLRDYLIEQGALAYWDDDTARWEVAGDIGLRDIVEDSEVGLSEDDVVDAVNASRIFEVFYRTTESMDPPKAGIAVNVDRTDVSTEQLANAKFDPATFAVGPGSFY